MNNLEQFGKKILFCQYLEDQKKSEIDLMWTLNNAF